MKYRFYHVLLEPESKPVTSIRTALRLLQFIFLPQGLKNVPGTFQRIVNTKFGDLKRRNVIFLVDELSVGTKNEEKILPSLNIC